MESGEQENTNIDKKKEKNTCPVSTFVWSGFRNCCFKNLCGSEGAKPLSNSKQNANHDDSISLHDLPILEVSNEGIDVSTNSSTRDDYYHASGRNHGHGADTSSRSSAPLHSPTAKKKREKCGPTKIISNISLLSL